MRSWKSFNLISWKRKLESYYLIKTLQVKKQRFRSVRLWASNTEREGRAVHRNVRKDDNVIMSATSALESPLRFVIQTFPRGLFAKSI